jgi:hypothetical protein
MTDKNKGHDVARGTRGAENADAAHSTSGLDPSGSFRIGDRISIGVRGGDVVLTQAHTGREITIGEETLAGLLEDEYFVEHRD